MLLDLAHNCICIVIWDTIKKSWQRVRQLANNQDDDIFLLVKQCYKFWQIIAQLINYLLSRASPIISSVSNLEISHHLQKETAIKRAGKFHAVIFAHMSVIVWHIIVVSSCKLVVVYNTSTLTSRLCCSCSCITYSIEWNHVLWTVDCSVFLLLLHACILMSTSS